MKHPICVTSFYLFVLLLLNSFSLLACESHKPAIQLPKTYQQGIDISHYWVSEKLDGVRAYWDGTRLISKAGNGFNAPAWFSAGFPNQAMDGELWISRNRFDEVSGIVRTYKPNEQDWQRVKFMIFDLPAAKGDFTARIKQMVEITRQTKSPYLKMISQFKVADTEKLDSLLKSVVAKGGEGLMLHRSNALYIVGRNANVLKLKQYYDSEAVVLKHIPGKGKYKNKMGALLVKNNEGVVFRIGSGFSDIERENPAKIGTVITYKYYGKTKNNKPRFASFMRIRQQAK